MPRAARPAQTARLIASEPLRFKIRDSQIVLNVRPRPVRHAVRPKARSSFVIRAFRCPLSAGTPAAAGRHMALNASNSAPHQLRSGPKSSPAPEAAPENRIAPNAKQRLAPFRATISRMISSLQRSSCRACRGKHAAMREGKNALISMRYLMAEAVGFEPTVGFPPRWFSRPEP